MLQPQGDCLTLKIRGGDTAYTGALPIDLIGDRSPTYFDYGLNWYLEGPGSLAGAGGGSATSANQTYTPPSTLPNDQPITVKVYFTTICPTTKTLQRSPEKVITIKPVTAPMVLNPTQDSSTQTGLPGSTAYFGVSPWPIPPSFADSPTQQSVTWTQEVIPAVDNPVQFARDYAAGGSWESFVKLVIPAKVDKDYDVRLTATMWDPWFQREASLVQVLHVHKN